MHLHLGEEEKQTANTVTLRNAEILCILEGKGC